MCVYIYTHNSSLYFTLLSKQVLATTSIYVTYPFFKYSNPFLNYIKIIYTGEYVFPCIPLMVPLHGSFNCNCTPQKFQFRS